MAKTAKKIPARTIERLVLYKRLLMDIHQKGREMIFSHELSELAHNTSAQVRRDLMTIGQEGCPHRGYDIRSLIERISKILGGNGKLSAALVGIGNLGRSLLSYFTYRHPGISVTAAFDIDPDKSGRVIAGCHCYALSELPQLIREQNIRVGIITVPADQAQEVADAMISAGVKGILNFAPVPLQVPDGVFMERIDIGGILEKLAYFSGDLS